MIKCLELNKEFATKEELFAELRKNKKQIIDFKTSQVFKACEKGASVLSKPLDITKALGAEKGIILDDKHYYIAINTTNILDSHKDLHVDGIWDKSARERNRKNYLVDTHWMSVFSTVARKEHVEIMVVGMPFSALGFKYQGNTQVLIYKVPKDKIVMPQAKEWLDSGDAIEGSVKMRYLQVSLAMKSEAQGDEEELKTFTNYIDRVANKQDFEDEILYFWVVKEAQNIGEGSLVLSGSNAVTGNIFEQKEVAEEITTEVIEPSEDTQTKEIEKLLSNIKF